MEQILTRILCVATVLFVAFLAVGCLSIPLIRLWRWLPSFKLWRLKRTTIVVLFVLSVIATIEAQKRTSGEGTSDSPSLQVEPDRGNTESPPLRETPTNSLHFAAISTGTNTVSLTLAWPLDLFVSGTVLDLFAATTLVETVWSWQCEHTVADGETNWITTVGHDGSTRFFLATERADPGDMRDTDDDGIPDVYELHNGTNPYVPDYAAAPKLTVGPNGAFTNIEAAVVASTAFSIIELDPSVSHEVGRQRLGCQIPLHPIMVTAPRPYAVVRSAELSAFMLATNTTSQTLFRNLYLLLDAKDSFQTGFWCGGNLPWSSVPAAATFQNIYMRMPNPDVQYRGWLFYAKCAERVPIIGCTLNAAGATWVTGIDAYDPPPLTIEGCSFVNFPSDSAGGNSCGILLRTSSLGGGTDVALSRTLFDESFVDAWPLGRFDSASPCSVAASCCILPCQFPMEYPPDVITNITVTNAALAWVGVPQPDSPSVALGVGSLAPISNDPSVDTDGDGLADYEEAYNCGTDPYLADSDNDGDPDWSEIHNGTDPTDPHSFTQTLTVTVTNTVSLAHPLYVAWGYSGTGWETNGLASFPDGCGTTNYTNASSHGAEFVKAYCDLNGNGEYDAAQDILLVREIPYGSTAHISFVFGDVDGDGVSDAQERTDGTDPYDKENYSFDMSVTVAGIFHTTNQLTLAATFGASTIVGPLLMSTNTWSADFVNLVVTNREKVVLTFWDDANSNGVHEAEETSVSLTPPVTNHMNVYSYKLSYGAFDRNYNGLLDWWEVTTGLNAEGVANRLYDDPDGDGLINLHEYWAGCDPLVPDGSNTLLSVAARSIDDRIRDVDPAASVARFNDYFANGSNGVFQANTNFWARDLDLSCVSAWQHGRDEPGSKAATLITRRHVVMAKHWWNNGYYTFCDTNGIIVVRSILRSYPVSADLLLGQLNEPLPGSFTPAKVLSADLDRYLSTGKYLPTLCLNHEKGATILELENLNCDVSAGIGNYCEQYGSTSQTNLVSRQRVNVRGATLDGNSGCPVFLVVGDELVLLFSKHLGWREVLTWMPCWGPMLSFRLEAIQRKIDEWEGADAGSYQVETLDLSAYDKIVNQ